MGFLKSLRRLKLSEVSRSPRWAVVASWLVGSALFIGLLVYLLRGQEFPLLQTRGQIATRERDLLGLATCLAVLVLTPVYMMLFSFAWRYRAGHKKDYKPEWDSDKKLEAIWWGVPIIIIAILATATWITSHSLDPYKPLASSQKTLHIQVIALQWKWLFVYPNESVASLNEVVLPAGRPVEFTITADAPMNSFWIPQLGGQIYAMPGMSTKLNLIADSVGSYQGMSSNISGKDFAAMHFKAKSVSPRDFARWVTSSQRSSSHLNWQEYQHIAQPGTMGVRYFHLHDQAVYAKVIMKYTNHQTSSSESGAVSDNQMGGMQ